MKHATLLDGLRLDPAPRTAVVQPTLLRYDLAPDVLERFYDDLRQPDWQARLKARSAMASRHGVPLVPQGRHRKCVIVVVDAACLAPGFPRLDPAKVVQAGMAIRREAGGTVQAWLRDRNDRPLGWYRVDDSALPADSRYDPDAALRRRRLTHTNPALGRKTTLTGDADGVSEAIETMHPIPPDIAAALGRTLYFAILRTTSQAVIPGEPPPPPFDAADVAARLPNLLRAQRSDDALPPTRAQAPNIGRTALRSAPSTIVDGLETNRLAALRSTLTWLAAEAGLFTGNPAAADLVAELQTIALSGGSSGTLLGWMTLAQARLVDGNVSQTTIEPPDAWPVIDLPRFARIRDAAFKAMAARWAVLAPSITRFGTIGDRYHVRCMLRIADCVGCPPRILWSPLSTAYTIRPWFEGDGGPVVQVEMPALTPANMAALTPDVAIKVPPEIQQYMDKLNLGDLMNGEARKGPSLSFGMICGFSIPIITLCAFILLSIIVSLLNIIFFWLPFVKICIPYPKVNE